MPAGGGAGPWPGVVVIHEAFGLNADEADATDSWRRIYAFFGEYLSGGRPAQDPDGIA